MAKQKKVEVRDEIREEIAQLLMAQFGLETMNRTKEGLVLPVGDKDLVIRVVQKKERVTQGDVIETLEFEGEFEDEPEDEEDEELDEQLEEELVEAELASE